MVAYPLQGCYLVHEAVVAALTLFGSEFRMRKETQRSHPVVDGDQDYAAIDSTLHPLVAVHCDLIAITVLEGSAMNPHGYRKVFSLDRRPNIKVQAVLALLRRTFPIEFISIEGSGRISGLRCNGAERIA